MWSLSASVLCVKSECNYGSRGWRLINLRKLLSVRRKCIEKLYADSEFVIPLLLCMLIESLGEEYEPLLYTRHEAGSL